MDDSAGRKSGAENGYCDDDFGSSACHDLIYSVMFLVVAWLESEDMSESAESIVAVVSKFLWAEIFEGFECGDGFRFDGLGGFDRLSMCSAKWFGQNFFDQSEFERGI